jgi:hypothetical protein
MLRLFPPQRDRIEGHQQSDDGFLDEIMKTFAFTQSRTLAMEFEGDRSWFR